MSADEIQPWDALGEPADVYAAFRYFLACPNPRKLTSVAAAFPQVTLQTIRNWAARWYWKERAAAWDRHLFAELDSEIEKQWAETAKNVAAAHLAAVRPLLAAITLDADKYLRQALESPTPVARNIGQLTMALQRLVQIERLVRGESTERVEHTGFDLTKLSDDELRQAEDLLRKTTERESEKT